MDELVQEEEKKAPLICLLTTGSDPCSQVEGMARLAETEYRQISMGQVGYMGTFFFNTGCRARRTLPGR